MSQLTLVIDLNRCTGCMGCNAACKMINEVPIGNYYNRVLNVGPTPKYEGAVFPDTEWYWLPMQCQYCENPLCVEVCPTGASAKLDDGTVQIDGDLCIGCQACLGACPYGVRFMHPETNVAAKCTLCAENREQGDIPQCVKTCTGLAKWYGDIDEDPSLLSFKGGYEKTLGEVVRDFTEDDVYTLPDSGNGPSIRYIMRRHQFVGMGDRTFATTNGY